MTSAYAMCTPPDEYIPPSPSRHELPPLLQMPPLWRITVLDELLRWFEAPNSLVEMFLNYDMDRKFTRQWKVFEQMVNVFCTIAEGRGEVCPVRYRQKQVCARVRVLHPRLFWRRSRPTPFGTC